MDGTRSKREGDLLMIVQFFKKKGVERYYTIDGSFIFPKIFDNGLDFYYEIVTEEMFNKDEHVYFPHDGNSYKIEKIERNAEGGIRCILDFYSSLEVDEESINKAKEYVESLGKIKAYDPGTFTKKHWLKKWLVF